MRGTRQLERRETHACRRHTTKDDGSVAKFDQSCWEELLPGIPDDITQFVIIPKLERKTYSTLLSVSRSWDQAMVTLAEARICLLAIDKTVIFETHRDYVCLISVGDGFTYRLPPMTNVGRGMRFQESCTFLFLEGKVYALEGFTQFGDVYVLDMFGERQWQQCTRMQYARCWEFFGCGACVVGGKICVYGGLEDIEMDVVELYDPESNTWDQIPLYHGQGVFDVLPEVEDAHDADCNLWETYRLKQLARKSTLVEDSDSEDDTVEEFECVTCASPVRLGLRDIQDSLSEELCFSVVHRLARSGWV